MDESTGMDAEPVKAEKYVQRWPNADYAYNDGYQHGYYAGQQTIKEDEKEKNMEGVGSDKTNIYVGEGRGSDSGASTAAVIAALGSRNQGSDNAALLAALGSRNQADMTPALIAALSGHDRHRGDDGFGFGGGGGILGLLAILGLLRGRGGLGGGDCDDNGTVERPVFNAAVLSKLGSIEGAIPTAALETQNQICESVSSLALGTQQGFANVKDSVQGLALYLANQLNAINTNVSDQGCRTRDTVQTTSTAILSRIDGNRIAELEAQIARMHSHDHARDSEIRISQTVNTNQQQAQVQAQLQSQFDQLFRRLGNIEFEQNQIAKNTNANLIIGSTGVATGAQSANPVNVR
jgi:hypothetical protein